MLRNYDPNTGRLLSQDPIGMLAGDPNYYRYVFNSPLGFIDPMGTSWNGTLQTVAIGAGAGLLIGAAAPVAVGIGLGAAAGAALGLTAAYKGGAVQKVFNKIGNATIGGILAAGLAPEAATAWTIARFAGYGSYVGLVALPSVERQLLPATAQGAEVDQSQQVQQQPCP
ncbi:MAG: RHS repeat-associated core domain-containing protein [Bdellovibrionota bacterium]